MSGGLTGVLHVSKRGLGLFAVFRKTLDWFGDCPREDLSLRLANSGYNAGVEIFNMKGVRHFNIRSEGEPKHEMNVVKGDRGEED